MPEKKTKKGKKRVMLIWTSTTVIGVSTVQARFTVRASRPTTAIRALLALLCSLATHHCYTKPASAALLAVSENRRRVAATAVGGNPRHSLRPSITRTRITTSFGSSRHFHQSSFETTSRRFSMSSTKHNNDNDVAAQARQARLFRRTPLIYSTTLSELCQKDVYLKLDCLQASGSFKDRGMAHLCWTLRQKQNCHKLICSSGGNAGLAVATVGRQLGMTVQVVVPTTTKAMVVQKLQSLGAEVTIHGEHWNAADALARQWVEQDPEASYISPYDNPLLWTGHSTLIDEIIQDLKELVPPPKSSSDDATTKVTTPTIGTLILSVGGGGLLCGALEGLERHSSQGSDDSRHQDSTTTTTATTTKTLVLAAETMGASSFGQALEAGKLVRLSSIDSIATSLGALEVTPVALQRATQTDAPYRVQSALCTDAEAVHACVQLAQDHRLLVEPACGAALAVAYSERLRQQYLLSPNNNVVQGPIVIEVCGGSGVNIDLLTQWKKESGV